MFETRYLSVCAHEPDAMKRKTVLMNFNEFRSESRQTGSSTANQAPDSVRYSVVSEWVDAERMTSADLSDEIAGQRVVAWADETNRVERYSSSAVDSGGVSSGVPGFLFSGDDGDSLWFWPVSEDIAFRFEPQAGSQLRRELSENVSSLVNQGALVYCLKIDTSQQGDLLFEFPASDQNAA